MTVPLHRAVSSRGQWRASYAIVASGVPDPASTVFALQVWRRDGCPGPSDYGFRPGFSQAAVLAAATDDGSARLTATVSDSKIILTWLFSTAEMGRLCAGSYEAGILAKIGDEMAEIERLSFVVQERGGAPAPSLAPPPSSGGGGDGGGGSDGGYAIDFEVF